MTTLHAELYDALLDAGASKEKAQSAAAGVALSEQVATKEDMVSLEARLSARLDQYQASLEAQLQEHRASLEAQLQEHRASLEAQLQEHRASLDARMSALEARMGQHQASSDAQMSTLETRLTWRLVGVAGLILAAIAALGVWG